MDRVTPCQANHQDRQLEDQQTFADSEYEFALAAAGSGNATDFSTVHGVDSESERARQAESCLVEQHGFTPQEAARFVGGDSTVFSAVLARPQAVGTAAKREPSLTAG